MQNDLGVIEENDLNYFVAQSENDSMLSSHPFLDQHRVTLILNDFRLILLHITFKVSLEVLHQSDLLLQLTWIIIE